MDIADYIKNKKFNGISQTRSLLEELKKNHEEFKSGKIKNPWVQKNELWKKLGQVKWTRPNFNFQPPDYKPFKHYTTFERLLERRFSTLNT